MPSCRNRGYKETKQLGPFVRTCNPSKLEDDIWGWLHYTVNQRPHWACQQYCNSGGTWGWIGVKRCQLCLQDISHSSKRHLRAAVCHWVSLCVRCCRMVDSVPRWQLSLSGPILSNHLSIADRMTPPLGKEHSHGKTSTFLESRSWWGHDCWKEEKKLSVSNLLI